MKHSKGPTTENELLQIFKHCCTNFAILAYFDFSAIFILDSDASDFGVCAVLSQKIKMIKYTRLLIIAKDLTNTNKII